MREKSQDELLTDAVAKVTPSVVSIVISKDVPKLAVEYVNPFGDDPFFRDFNIQVPVYRQKGTINKKVGGGSGFIITSNGYILTNRHVVLDTAATYSVLLSDGSQKVAKVVYKDAEKDIAIIKIDGTGYKPIALGNSDALKLGETVVAIGNALGQFQNSVTTGVISGIGRNVTASGTATNNSQATVVVTAVNSGIDSFYATTGCTFSNTDSYRAGSSCVFMQANSSQLQELVSS